MWYVAKNYYSPEEPNFELTVFTSKKEVQEYLFKYIIEMTNDPLNNEEDKEFYQEIKNRHNKLIEKYPGDLINQSLELLGDEDEDWKVDIILNIEPDKYGQWTEGNYEEVEMSSKWLVYKIVKEEDQNLYEFELGIFSNQEDMLKEYYDDYSYEVKPQNISEWVEEVLVNMDEDNAGIVAIQNLEEELVPVWSLEYDEED